MLGEHSLQAAQHAPGDQPQAGESTKVEGRACPALSRNTYAKDHPDSGVSKC